jgi:uncharacterized protein YdeI (YjbR/CyaY-like superfamily)
MRVRRSSENQQQQDPEWVTEFASFLERNGNKKKFQSAKKIFIDTYFENVRNGMHPKEALQNAKSVALCFLLLHQ